MERPSQGEKKHTRTHIPTHTHPFNGPLSGTTRVRRYHKGKTNLDFTEARDSEWQWHQLGHMQVCTSFQTDNHASTSPLSFLHAGCSSCLPAAQPTVQSTEAKKKLFVKYSEIYCHFVSVGKRQNSALCTLINLNHEWIPRHSRTKIIFHDFSGPWKFRKKFQDFPGGARTLRYVVVVRNSISLLTFYPTNIYTHAYIHSWLQRLNHFACFPWKGKASPFPESYQQTHSNRSAISFLRQLSTWHCSHLLLSVALWPRAAAPLLLGAWRSISHAHTVVSSKPAACHGCGRTTG